MVKTWGYDNRPTSAADSDSDDDDKHYYCQQPPEQIHLDDLLRFEPPPMDTFYIGDGFTPYPDEIDDTVELHVSRELAHWHNLCDRQLDHDEMLVFIANKHRVSAVIRRVFDNLTPEEITKHKDEVEAAMFDELKRWHTLETFRRFPRNKSTNPIDGTWVLKWKSVRGTNDKGEEVTKRIVKARLTARGFKDLQAFDEDVDTFSGTC